MKQHHSWHSNNSILGVETETIHNLSVIVTWYIILILCEEHKIQTPLQLHSLHENEAWYSSFWLKFIQNYTPKNRAWSSLSYDVRCLQKFQKLYVRWLAGRPRRGWEDNTAIDTTWRLWVCDLEVTLESCRMGSGASKLFICLLKWKNIFNTKSNDIN
jgi:hypothetical protein